MLKIEKVGRRFELVKEVKEKEELEKRKKWLKNFIINSLKEKPMRAREIRKKVIQKYGLSFPLFVFVNILNDLKRKGKVRAYPTRKRIWFLSDRDYARKCLIKPIGEDIADELSDFFDLEKVDREFAKKLMEKPRGR